MAKPYKAVTFFAYRLQRETQAGSICTDMTYGDLFDGVQHLQNDPEYDKMMGALEELYVVLDIGTLAADHIERERIEKEWMIKEGFRNADDT